MPSSPMAVFKQFTSDFAEGFGDDPAGMSYETAAKTFGWSPDRKPGQVDGLRDVFKAFNETLIMGGAAVLDSAARVGSGLYRGLQGAGVAAGVPQDVVSIPDAFMGAPGIGLDPPAPTVRPSPIQPIRNAVPWARSVAGRTGIPEVDLVLNSWPTRNVIDNPVVDRSHDVPYMAGGSAPLADPTVYVDRHVPATQTISGVTFDPADPWTIHENVEQHTMELLIRGGMSAQDAYKVAHFEFAEPAEQAWYRAHGIDQVAAEKEQMSWLPRIQHESPENPPPNLYEKPYPHAHVQGAEHESIEETRPSDDAVLRAKAIIRNTPELKNLTYTDLAQARETGVIGPDKPTINDGTPAEVSTKLIQQSAAMPGPLTLTEDGYHLPDKPTTVAANEADKSSLPAKQGSRELMSPEDTAFAQRLDEFIGKLEVPEDFKNLLREAAQRGGTFPEARTGDIPLSHQGSLEEATGMRLDEMTLRGMGRLLKNDGEVRVAMQTLLTTTDKVFEAARDADMTGDPKDLIALQEAIMRRDLALEQVVGLRAEWGRTGNVFQEFTEKVNDAQTLGQFLKDKGKYTVDDLKTIAKNLRGLNDRGAQARLLTDLRKPTLWDKWMYVWTNGLLSGLFTHARYIIGNTMFAAHDAMIITPAAGAIGAARQLFSKDQIDRVFVGEGPARVWGMVKGTEQGIISAVNAIATGVPDALPRQVSLNVNPYTGQKPIKGVAGDIIGIPSHAIAAIHSFYNVIGYRAQIEAEAYRSAAKAGLKPTDPNFWTHMHDQSMYPTEEAMDAAVKNGSRITFTDPLGPKGQALQAFLNTTKVGKMVVPFLRVSSNVFKGAQEATAGALLNKDMRDNLTGKNGDIARDTQYARLAVGTAIGGMVAYWAANDHITDNGPPNKEDHDIWRLTHEPNSIKIGDYWVSYDRLGPLGPYLGMVAGLTHSIKDISDKDVGTATERIVLGISQDIVNEVGMQGLSDLIQAKTDPARYGKKYMANLGASFIPYSSGASQWASVMDPEQRTTNNLVDVMKSKVPWLLVTLYPVRDWKGLPLANSREEMGAVIKNRQVNIDSIDQEMSALQIHPTKVEPQIKGVQLTPDQYDRYQTTAGVMTQTALTALVTGPSFQPATRCNANEPDQGDHREHAQEPRRPRCSLRTAAPCSSRRYRFRWTRHKGSSLTSPRR